MNLKEFRELTKDLPEDTDIVLEDITIRDTTFYGETGASVFNPQSHYENGVYFVREGRPWKEPDLDSPITCVLLKNKEYGSEV